MYLYLLIFRSLFRLVVAMCILILAIDLIITLRMRSIVHIIQYIYMFTTHYYIVYTLRLKKSIQPTKYSSMMLFHIGSINVLTAIYLNFSNIHM